MLGNSRAFTSDRLSSLCSCLGARAPSQTQMQGWQWGALELKHLKAFLHVVCGWCQNKDAPVVS